MRKMSLISDKGGKAWIWLIVIIVLLAVIYFAFFFNKGGSTNGTGTETGSDQESNVDSAPASELNNLQNSDDDFAALDEAANSLV